MTEPNDLKGELAELVDPPYSMDTVTYAQKCETFFRTHGARLKRALEDGKLRLTGLQIQHLADFTDGSLDADITIQRCDERPVDQDGNERPAGLYAWFTEYPDEGAIYLPEFDTARASEQTR